MALMSLLAPAAAEDSVLSSGAGFAGVGGMDPMTGAMISAGSSVLGKALAPSSAGPSRAESGGQNWLTMDHSGWTVATGGSKADAVRGLDLPSWVWIAAAVVAVVWVRRNKS